MKRKEIKNSILKQHAPFASAIMIEVFMQKVYDHLTSREMLSDDDKNLLSKTLVWSAWRCYANDLFRERFMEGLDERWQKAYESLCDYSPFEREKLINKDDPIKEIIEFDYAMEDYLKSELPIPPDKKLADKFSDSLKFYVLLYSFLNVGDDLFAHILFSRYPDVVFAMPFSESYEKLFCDYPNVLAIKSTMPLWANGYVNDVGYDEYSGYIEIGGSIFPDFFAYRFFMFKYISECFIERGKKVFVLGSNVDRNYRNPLWDVDTFSSFFAEHEGWFDICLRDQYSYSMFKASGCARYEPDIVFGFDDTVLDRCEPNERKGIGISIIETRDREGLKHNHEAYMEGLVSIIKEATSQSIPVTLFAFCKFEGDEEAVKELMTFLNEKEKENVSCNLYDGKLIDFLRDFASMEYIISTRFHATILALKFRQKVFPVVYGDKIESLLSDLGGYDNGASYDLRKEDKWDTRKVWKSFKEDRINEEKLSQWETAAKRHFTVLDEYINKLQ